MIPKTMKAYQVTGKETGAVNIIPVPELADDNSILIKNETAAICNMTDTHIFELEHEPNGPNAWDTPLPFTLGHESAGIVVKKGVNVTDVEIGDRVALNGFFESGSFAEYTMAKDNYLKLPSHMDAVQGSMLEMVSCTNLVVEANVVIGNTVCILGAGAAGSLIIKQCKAAGVTKMIVSEPNAGKREYALSQGADFVIDPSTEDVQAKVKEYTNGEMVDVVIEASGYPDAQGVMTGLVRRSGRIGMFGVCPTPVTLSTYDLHMAWSSISSVGFKRGYTKHAQVMALRLVESGVIDVSDMVTHRITLEGVTDALKMIQERKENIRKVLIEF